MIACNDVLLGSTVGSAHPSSGISESFFAYVIGVTLRGC